MATLLQVTNKVLRRLREDTVTATSDNAYATLVAALVNDTKREVEDAWTWTYLRSPITISCTASQSYVDLTGTNRRSKILDAYNSTINQEIVPIPSSTLNRWTYTSSSVSSTNPEWYRQRDLDSSGQLRVDLYPTPSSTDSLVFFCYIPQAEVTSDSTEIDVPEDPLVYGTWAKAISERGEDGGQLYEEVMAQYIATLGAAIALDADKVQDETTWTVC